jgi:hypothetical protein
VMAFDSGLDAREACLETEAWKRLESNASEKKSDTALEVVTRSAG